MQGTIYAIFDLALDRPVYVGQTKQKPAARWEQHRTRRTPLSSHIRAKGKASFRFDVIETVPLGQLDEREAHWVIALDTLHPQGLNVRRGGANGGFNAVAKAKVSAKSLAMWQDPEFRAKRAASLAARWQDPEYRAKMSEARRAMWADPVKRDEIVQKQREVQQRPERRAAHGAKIREKWADPAYKAATSAAMAKSHPARANDPDYRASMAARARARWDRSPKI